MLNPYKNTEPDFSKVCGLQSQPDGEPFYARIFRAQVKGDFETALLEFQKMLYVWGRNHPDTAKMLCGVGNGWEKLGRLDRAIAYHEEAVEVLKDTSVDNYKTIYLYVYISIWMTFYVII